jgi:hypothetical protein
MEDIAPEYDVVVLGTGMATPHSPLKRSRELTMVVKV